MGAEALAKLLAAASLTFACAAPLQAQTHAHEDAAAHKLELNQGRKWASDEPLRKGMAEIRNLMGSRASYATRGAKVEEQVAYIVANCKLEPRADANLHIVLADLIAGADAMQGKDKKTSPRAGAIKVVGALNAYGRYFEHPGWKPL